MNRRIALSFLLAASLGLNGLVMPVLPEQEAVAASATYKMGTRYARELREADQMMQTGHYEKAEAKYQAALKKNPNNVQARSRLAQAQASLYKLDAAERNARMALNKNSKLADAHLALGIVNRNRTASQDRAYRGMKDIYLSESQRHLETAIMLDPKSPEAYNELGTTLRFQGRYDEAMKAFQKALSLDPKFAEAMVNQGMVAASQGRVDDAQMLYRRAIDLNSKNYMAHYRMGEAYLMQGDSHRALKSLNTALYLNRDNAAVMSKMGEAYQQQGNAAAAISSFRKAMHANPSYMPAYVGMANLYDSRGDGELAMAELKSALNVNHNYNPARNQLGRLALTVEKPDQALQYFKESLANNPEDAEALQGMSQALSMVAQRTATGAEAMGQESDLADAEAAVNEALKHNPRDIRLHLAALRISQLAGKPAATQTELEKIVGMPANTPAERMIQGEAHLQLGNYPAADRIFTSLREQYRQDPAALLAMGDTLKAQGDLHGARAAYAQAQQAQPGNLKAQRALQRIDKTEAESQKSLRLATALNNRKQRNSSVDFYEEALSKNQRQPEIRLALAKLYEKSRRPDKAAISYQHYLGLRPDLTPEERQKIERKIAQLQEKFASENRASRN